MKELTQDEVRGLGHAVGLEIQDPEQTVLNVAYAYQQATDWHGRDPFHPKHPQFVPVRAYDWEANR